MTVKGAIFDLDGTLLDSMGVWQQVDRDFLGRRGIPVPEKYMEIVGAMSFSEAARYTVDRFGFDIEPEELMKEWFDQACDAYSHRVEAKPGVKAFLEELKARGVLLGVATASDPALFMPALKRNGLLPLFDAVTTLDEVQRGKGFPDIYDKCAEKLGLTAAECAVFEDLPAGITGALMGRFLAVAVRDVYAAREEDRLRREADYYIESFEEAENVLRDVLPGRK